MSEEVTADVEEVAEVVEQAQAETPETTTDYSKLVGADGKFTEEFYSSLPDDLGSHSSIQQQKDIVSLAKSYMNTKGLVGKKLEEFWTSEDEDIVAKRNEIMGVPEDADGYDIAVPEVPEGVPYDETALNAFKEKAAELGIPVDTAKALVEWDAERATNAFNGVSEQVQQQTAKAEEELKTEWGSKFEYNVSKVQQATDFLGITETVNEMGLGRSPEFLKAVLDKIVPAISNDNLVESQQKDTLASISDNLDEIEAEMFKFDGNAQDPEYKTLVKKRAELLARLK